MAPSKQPSSNTEAPSGVSAGVPRTHLAIALGLAACGQGRKVRFFRVTELITLLLEAREEKTLLRLCTQIKQPDLVILDAQGSHSRTPTKSEISGQSARKCQIQPLSTHKRKDLDKPNRRHRGKHHRGCPRRDLLLVNENKQATLPKRLDGDFG